MSDIPATTWRERATLLHADYRVTLAACAEMGGADLVLTSPPYVGARGYGADVVFDLGDYAALGDAAFAALKPGGWAIVNIDANVAEWRPGMGTERGLQPFRVLLDWADRIGFRVPDRLAFGRMGCPGVYAGRFRNDWEPLLWFQRPGVDGYFDKAAIVSRVEPYARSAMGRHNVRNGERYERNRLAQSPAAMAGIKNRGTLWDYGNVAPGNSGAPDIEAQNHPARWPYKLAEDIVRCFCPPGGLACDPFLGGGTSLVAALEHGRRFVGGDLLARQADGVPWVDVAAGVAEARFRQQRLFGPASASEVPGER